MTLLAGDGSPASLRLPEPAAVRATASRLSGLDPTPAVCCGLCYARALSPHTHSRFIRAITCLSHQHWPIAFSSLVADRPGRSNLA